LTRVKEINIISKEEKKMEGNYMEKFNYVKNELSENDGNATKIIKFPFRIRSEHIWRVFNWAKKLIDIEEYRNINTKSLLTAAIFHDVGYAISPDSKDHAINSEIIFRKYSKENNFSKEEEDFIAYLVKNHSNKSLMENEETPIELIILFEADLLDETGAMSILWDCMAEGGKEKQSYIGTYEHIKANTMKILNGNPMKTKKGIEYWEKKQELVKHFIKELESDLEIENQDIEK
jgi:uncharacterized protein